MIKILDYIAIGILILAVFGALGIAIFCIVNMIITGGVDTTFGIAFALMIFAASWLQYRVLD